MLRQTVFFVVFILFLFSFVESKKKPQLFEPKTIEEFEKIKTRKLVVVVL